MNLSATVTGLPTNGSTIHVRLWSKIGSNWPFVDYTYKAKPTPQVMLVDNDVRVQLGNESLRHAAR